MTTGRQVGIELTPDLAQKLWTIPSATTINERQLALLYAADIWDGTGNVFENGPLLGGSTRALALGMEFNKQKDEDCRLHTYDWFSTRQPLDLPADVWIALTQAGLLTTEQVDQAHEAGTFLPLFEALHEEEDYWPLVHPHVGYLPGHRDDVPSHGETVFSTPDPEFGLAFVDGCKSWYGTKHWFREVSPRLLPNADIMFQDFGHYTCFWLPMLVGTFREHFQLRAYVDHTYVWRVLSVPTESEIEEGFPDEPTCLDRAAYDEVFGALYREAIERQDAYHVLAIQMQQAAAYAYIDLRDESREVLDRLLTIADYLPLRDYIKSARVSPAYTPEGRIEL